MVQLTMNNTSSSNNNNTEHHYSIAALALPLLSCKYESHSKCLQLLSLSFNNTNNNNKRLIKQLFKYGLKLEEALDYSSTTKDNNNDFFVVENNHHSLLLDEKEDDFVNV